MSLEGVGWDEEERTNLDGTLKVLDVVTLNIVVRSDGLFELYADDHTRTLGRWSTHKQHHPRSSLRERRLQTTIPVSTSLPDML